jgi:hypothetical protein
MYVYNVLIVVYSPQETASMDLSEQLWMFHD